MMRDFHLSMEEALGMPLARALALKAWSIEANPWGGVVRMSDGYIEQERQREVPKVPKVP